MRAVATLALFTCVASLRIGMMPYQCPRSALAPAMLLGMGTDAGSQRPAWVEVTAERAWPHVSVCTRMIVVVRLAQWLAGPAPLFAWVHAGGKKAAVPRTVGEAKEAFQQAYGAPVGSMAQGFVNEMLTSVTLATVTPSYKYSRIFAVGFETLCEVRTGPHATAVCTRAERAAAAARGPLRTEWVASVMAEFPRGHPERGAEDQNTRRDV